MSLQTCSLQLSVVELIPGSVCMNIKSITFQQTCLVRRRSQWSCQVRREGVATGKKSQSFIKMEALWEEMSDNATSRLYNTSDLFLLLSKTNKNMRTKKPCITVPLGLKTLSKKVQCYCELEVFIIHLGFAAAGLLAGLGWFWCFIMMGLVFLSVLLCKTAITRVLLINMDSAPFTVPYKANFNFRWTYCKLAVD